MKYWFPVANILIWKFIYRMVFYTMIWKCGKHVYCEYSKWQTVLLWPQHKLKITADTATYTVRERFPVDTTFCNVQWIFAIKTTWATVSQMHCQNCFFFSYSKTSFPLCTNPNPTDFVKHQNKISTLHASYSQTKQNQHRRSCIPQQKLENARKCALLENFPWIFRLYTLHHRLYGITMIVNAWQLLKSIQKRFKSIFPAL